MEQSEVIPYRRAGRDADFPREEKSHAQYAQSV